MSKNKNLDWFLGNAHNSESQKTAVLKDNVRSFARQEEKCI